MISIFCGYCQEQDALYVLKEMEFSSCKPVLHTYSPLLKLCFKLRKFDQLDTLLNDVIKKQHLSLDLDTYTLLIHGLCSAGKIMRAFHLFDEMVSKRIPPRTQTAKMLMHEAGEEGMDEIVEKIIYISEGFDATVTRSDDRCIYS